jgi:MoxR-like ATPase
MEYKEGAVMSQIVLADEINRTSPKTQSALLEVMEEHQVTVDGITHQLPQPFIVLATQNPGEFVGTYPLPEAQVDRFFLRISIGYPTIEQEMDVLERYSGTVPPMETIEPICSAQDVLAMQEQVTTVYCSPEVRNYVASLAAATRNDQAFTLGASTRAAISLIRGAQACAMLDDRDFVLPEDVQHMFLPVMAHRMILSPEARMKGVPAEQFLLTILQNTNVPVKL